MIQCFKKPVLIDSKEKKGTFYYASFSRKGTADSVALAEEMKEGSSSFTKGEVVGVTLDLPLRIKQALLAGMAVKINGLGTFKPSLQVAEVKEKPEELKTSAIRIKGLNFAPDPVLLSDLNAKAKYEWIEASKADSEDANDDAASGDDQQQGGQQTPPTDREGDDDTSFDS